MTQLADSSLLLLLIIIITEMVLKLPEEIGHFLNDNDILKMKMETISATERPSMACVHRHVVM
jgi:hypothetical protein